MAILVSDFRRHRGHMQRWIWINCDQLVPHVLIYLSTKFHDDPSYVRSLIAILVLDLCKGLVRVLYF